jgi:hypothetical protein
MAYFRVNSSVKRRRGQLGLRLRKQDMFLEPESSFSHHLLIDSRPPKPCCKNDHTHTRTSLSSSTNVATSMLWFNLCTQQRPKIIRALPTLCSPLIILLQQIGGEKRRLVTEHLLYNLLEPRQQLPKLTTTIELRSAQRLPSLHIVHPHHKFLTLHTLAQKSLQLRQHPITLTTNYPLQLHPCCRIHHNQVNPKPKTQNSKPQTQNPSSRKLREIRDNVGSQQENDRTLTGTST